MVKQTIAATVFVSSPGDVQQERDAVQTTVAKWNSRNSATRGVSFSVWGWEENSVPDYGEDAQSVMNTQIPADYDILVGIFWSRLGTPTGRAGSGTVEEIEAAIRRRESDGSPHIAVYFKKDNYPIDSIDLVQLERLRDFESSLRTKALVNQFAGIQTFEAQIERLLDKKADEYRGALGETKLPLEPPRSTARSTTSTDRYEEYGLFDLIEEGEKNLTKSSTVLNEISEKLTEYNLRVNDITGRIEVARKYGEVSIQRMRPLVNEASREMNDLTNFIDDRLEAFSVSFTAATEMAPLILDVASDFDTKEGEVESYRQAVIEMRDNSQSTIDSQIELRDTILSLPRLDVKTNQAKKRLAAAIDSLTDTMRAGIDRLADI